MKNIFDLMQVVSEETGARVELIVTITDEGDWCAVVSEGGYTLLDRNGEKFLKCFADTAEEALEALNEKCA